MSEGSRAEREWDTSGESAVGSPEEHGWAYWVGGCCSVIHCLETPFAAVERAARGRRTAYWQIYCEAHSEARGVRRAGDGLDWTQEYLDGSERRNRV
jgi:hypothetical protein